MQIAHKVELSPNNKQKTYFAKASGTARFAWNWALAEWEKQYSEGKRPSGMSLKKEFNAIKKQQFPWIKEVTKYAPQQPFLDLQDAWRRFFKKLAGKPRFKKKGKSHDAFYIGADQIKMAHKKIWVPRLGWVRMREAFRFEGKVNSVTISRTADRWYVAIQVEANVDVKPCRSKQRVGVDLGINKLATLSSGIAFEAPKPLKAKLRKLKRYQRKLQKKRQGSNNRHRQQIKTARIHAKITDIRKDTLHKITTYITQHYSEIGIEDLNVKGMVKNHKLARHIHDVGLGEFRRQIEYKSKMRGNVIHLRDRYFPSSKACSRCGEIKKFMSLSERIFECGCGLKMDRDLNASINLRNYSQHPAPAGHGPLGTAARKNVRPVRSELTPVEITALRKQAGLVFVTSIDESGNKLQPAMSRFG